MRATRTALLVTLATSLSTLPCAAFATAPSDPPTTQEEPTAPVPTDTGTSNDALPPSPDGNEQPADVSGGTLPLLPDPETPVARDVGVEELPLLVKEPPSEQKKVTIPAPVTGGGDSALNPFSPLLLPQTAPPVAAPPTTPAPSPAPTQPPPVASPPVAPTPSAAAPAPRPAAPVPPARASRPTLPRSLGASLRTPASAIANPETGPLGRALGVQSTETDFGPPSTLATIRTPSSLTPLGTAPTANTAAAPIPSSAQQVALGSGLTTLGLGAGDSASDGNFTSLGGNRVSRALSSLQVHFTAMVTGTAIFRVGDDTMPVLLALGESLPGTGLKLTNLTSRGAEFTEDDVRHTLFLTP